MADDTEPFPPFPTFVEDSIHDETPEERAARLMQEDQLGLVYDNVNQIVNEDFNPVEMARDDMALPPASQADQAGLGIDPIVQTGPVVVQVDGTIVDGARFSTQAGHLDIEMPVVTLTSSASASGVPETGSGTATETALGIAGPSRLAGLSGLRRPRRPHEPLGDNSLPSPELKEAWYAIQRECSHPPVTFIKLDEPPCCILQPCTYARIYYPTSDEEDMAVPHYTDPSFDKGPEDQFPNDVSSDVNDTPTVDAALLKRIRDGAEPHTSLSLPASLQPPGFDNMDGVSGRLLRNLPPYVFAQKDSPGQHPPYPVKRSIRGRTLHCQFERNGVFFLRHATYLPPAIAQHVRTLVPGGSGKEEKGQCPPVPRKHSTLASLGPVYFWSLVQIDMVEGTHHGVRRFMERLLLASLHLAPTSSPSSLRVYQRPRMRLRTDWAGAVPFADRIRSPIPDLLYGYKLGAVNPCPEGFQTVTEWLHTARPVNAVDRLLYDRKDFLFRMYKDVGGRLVFPFLSFEFRGYDGDDYGEDNTRRFNRRRAEAVSKGECQCHRCHSITSSFGTAELDCMAAATASVRIVERLNRRLRVRRKLQGYPVLAHEEPDFDLDNDFSGHEYYAHGGALNNTDYSQPAHDINFVDPLKVLENPTASGSTSSSTAPEASSQHPLPILVRPVPAIAFSVAVTSTEARIFVTWRRRHAAQVVAQGLGSKGLQKSAHDSLRDVDLDDKTDDDNNVEAQASQASRASHARHADRVMRRYYTAKIATFSLQDPEHHMKFRFFLENIFNWGAGPRLAHIREVMQSI